MTINKQLIPILFTAFLLTNCASSQNARKIESLISPSSEPEVATTTEPQPTEDIPQSSSGSAENQAKTITQSSSEVATQQLNRRVNQFTVRIDGVNSTTAQNKQDNNIIAQQEDATEPNSGIQEGQLVNDGFEGAAKVEILKVKRIQNPETGKRDLVAVSLRLKRIQEKPRYTLPNLYYYQLGWATIMNIDTFEEYYTIQGKYTDWINFTKLPLDAWADAYFWSQVPEEIEVVDIMIPYTEIFRNVPIEG